MNNDFGLSAEELWFTSVYAVKIMLSKWRLWSGYDHINSLDDFLKRMSCWHQYCLIPMTKKITKYHHPPDFAKKAIKAQDGNVFGMHISLLLEASKSLLGYYGPDTLDEVSKWFGMMKTTTDSEIFNKAPKDMRKEFKRILSLRRQPNDDEHCHQQLPFFNCQILFLRVAHLVVLYTNSGLWSMPSIKTATPVDRSHMKEWELLSGELLTNVLQTEEHGLPLTDGINIRDVQFGGIVLPYQKLKHQLLFCKGPGLPDVTLLHRTVMISLTQEASRKLSTLTHIADVLHYQIQLVQQTFSVANAHNDDQKSKLQNTEKVRKHYRKVVRKGKSYSPRHPVVFQRDIFVMGHESHYFKSKDKVGRGYNIFELVIPCRFTAPTVSV